jgi:hypothetical protein
MSKKLPEGVGELFGEENGEVIKDAVCFNYGYDDSEINNQTLTRIGDGRFRNDRGDIYEYDHNSYGYRMIERAIPPEIVGEMARLKEIHPDWPTEKLRFYAGINLSKPKDSSPD